MCTLRTDETKIQAPVTLSSTAEQRNSPVLGNSPQIVLETALDIKISNRMDISRQNNGVTQNLFKRNVHTFRICPVAARKPIQQNIYGTGWIAMALLVEKELNWYSSLHFQIKNEFKVHNGWEVILNNGRHLLMNIGCRKLGDLKNIGTRFHLVYWLRGLRRVFCISDGFTGRSKVKTITPLDSKATPAAACMGS